MWSKLLSTDYLLIEGVKHQNPLFVNQFLMKSLNDGLSRFLRFLFDFRPGLVLRRCMAGTRAQNKMLLGGHVDEALVAGVETWLAHCPGKTKTDFIVEACTEKLAREGITVELEPQRSSARRRRLPPSEAFKRVKVARHFKRKNKEQAERILRKQAEEVCAHIKSAVGVADK